ncbi:hypothetical protein AWC38_SpisGene16293 [Stylophora pistillata]|uniref:DDE Tnp4 domain-containing protein n=1 Tax=Stylophora pistillata TaxID=50429 RepID=A0A2B4RSR9_STYPI|nr:hypothetical protein AWC38_SpisGene16293 [Stylophora pistillata]
MSIRGLAPSNETIGNIRFNERAVNVSAQEVLYLRQEVRDESQGIKDQLGEKVESTAQEVQRLGQEVREEAQSMKDQFGGEAKTTTEEVRRLGQQVRDEAQGIKDQLGGKVESTAQEVQRLRQELRDEAQDMKDQLELGGRPKSVGGVKLLMWMNCETIPDPHPQRETSRTVAIASQGTQACVEELGVTGTSERTDLDTQDTRAGRHEKVVTGVKRKAVEPVISVGLQRAGRPESVGEAGHLNDMAQKYLVTKDVLKEFDVIEVNMTTTIQMEDYMPAHIEIAAPKLMSQQNATYSSYRGMNSFKVIIGVAPNGVITYVSDLFPGSVSDKVMVKESGFCKHLSAGDLVLADKGFLISDVVPRGVSVNIPPFLNNGKFTESEARATKSIARCRIHVERANARLKSFRILGFIPAFLRCHADKCKSFIK